MSPATPAGRCRIPVATLLALLAWGAIAVIEGRSAPPVGGTAHDGAAAGMLAAGLRIAAGPAGHAAPVATVLGKSLETNDPEALRHAILTPLLDHYAAQRGIRAEPPEIDAALEKMRRDRAASAQAPADDLTPQEQAEVDTMLREMFQALIRQWKINKALGLRVKSCLLPWADAACGMVRPLRISFLEGKRQDQTLNPQELHQGGD